MITQHNNNDNSNMKDNKTVSVKNNRPLTKKQALFIKELTSDPKLSATQAVKRAYNVSNDNTASSIASENLRKPAIVSELAKYNNLIENTLINTVNDWGDSDNTRRREIAIDTSKFIHDKIHGRATQRVQSESTAVTLNINLSDI